MTRSKGRVYAHFFQLDSALLALSLVLVENSATLMMNTSFKYLVLSAVWFSIAFLSCARAAYARTPIPFTNPGKDGLVLVLWSDYTDAAIQQMLERIKQTGTTTISLPLFGCQTSITSSDVGACSLVASQFEDKTLGKQLAAERDTAIHLAQLAIAAGLQPVFLPIIATPKWDWRGFFDPTDVNAWFQSYDIWIKGVAQDANQLGMKELIVGSEFTKLYAYGSNWSSLLADVRTTFSGPLIVTVNWGQLDFGFWDQADAIGVSEYYPITSLDNPTQAELDQGAQSVKQSIMSAGEKYGRPIYLTEVGFPSTVNGAKVPWQIFEADPSDFALQAQCFQAFSNAWSNEPQLARSFVWATGDLSDPQYANSYEILGKPAEAVMKSFFAARAQHSSSK
jgi:hypothetical protein